MGLIGEVGHRHGVEHLLQMTVATTWALRCSSEGAFRSLFRSADVSALRAQHPEHAEDSAGERRPQRDPGDQGVPQQPHAGAHEDRREDAPAPEAGARGNEQAVRLTATRSASSRREQSAAFRVSSPVRWAPLNRVIGPPGRSLARVRTRVRGYSPDCAMSTPVTGAPARS